tara:strand:+ start:682 stop:981 length:300 start_codon:yes stop_codon:yes gene_type:complete
MHYIIGTEIHIQNRPVDPRDPKTYRTRKVTGDFKPGVRYNLYHIRKDKENKMRYVFISNDQSDVVGLVFDTITEADRYISSIKNEQLPNYHEIYSRNTS